ncbi:MAG: glycosyltransferase family 39 protein [Candidatus Omnitrophica bacterium]|nr:glycosyltransferase family 39 protein [Candidatus Omnitrophota bacterium]
MSNIFGFIASVNRKIFFLIFLFCCVIILKFPVINIPYHWDAMVRIWETSGLVENNFNPLGLSRVTTFHYLFGLIWIIFGKSLLVGHIFNIFIAVIGLYFIFLLSEYAFNRRVAYISVIFTLFCPLYFAQTGILNFSILLTTLNMAVLYYAFKDRVKPYLFFGLLLVFTKETGFLAIVAILVYQLARGDLSWPERLKKSLIYSVPLIFLILFFSVFRLHYQSHIYYKWFASSVDVILGKVTVLFKELFMADFRWILTLAILFFLIRAREIRKNKIYYLFVLAGLAHFCMFSLFTFHLFRYQLPLLAIFFIISAKALSYICRKSKLVLSVVVCSIVFLSLLNFDKHRVVMARAGSGAILEDNMEYLDVVKTHRQAVRFIEENYPDSTVLTIWPMTMELQFPYLGYTNKAIKAIDVYNYVNVDLREADIVYYSPQSDNPMLLRRKMDELGAVEIKRFDKNGKSAVVLRVTR